MRTRTPFKSGRREGKKRNARKMSVSGKSVFVMAYAQRKRAAKLRNSPRQSASHSPCN